MPEDFMPTSYQSESKAQALPHSEETEHALLACVLLQPEIFSVMRVHMAPPVPPKRIRGEKGDRDLAMRDHESSVFYSSRSQHVWSAYCAIVDGGRGIDLRTCQAQLESDGRFQEVGGLAFIAGLDIALPDLSGAMAYAQVVRDCYRKKLLVELSQAMRQAAAGTVMVDETVAKCTTALTTVANFSTVTAGELDIGDQLDLAGPAAEGAPPPSLSSSIPDLDRRRMFQPDTLVVLGGRPGHCKSILAGHIAEHVAMKEEKRVLFFSLEMSSSLLFDRLATSAADVHFDNYQDAYIPGRVTHEQRDRVADYFRRLEVNGCLDVRDKPRRTLGEIRTITSVEHARDPISLVVIDHLGLISFGRPAETQTNFAEAARELKVLAKELGLPILLLSQMNRNIYSRPGWIPRMSDLRAAGEIEEHADCVFFTVRPIEFEREVSKEGDISDEYGERELNLYVRKNRRGTMSDITLDFEGSKQRVRCIDTVHHEKGWK